MLNVELAKSQHKAIRSVSKTLVEFVRAIDFSDLSEERIQSEYRTESFCIQLDNFRKSIKEITGHPVRLGNMHIVEMCVRSRYCLSPDQVQMLFIDDRRYEQIEDEKRRKYQAERDEKIKDIKQGISMEDFCNKYLATCRYYYHLRDKYAKP